jgi:hypothetical protein
VAFHVRGGGRRQFTRLELFNGFRHLKRPSTFSRTVGSNTLCAEMLPAQP